MPKLLQGDIYDQALTRVYDAAVVFGYIGLNAMGSSWMSVRKRVTEWTAIDDPFKQSRMMRVHAKTPCWYFVADEENHGLSDEHFIASFNQCLTEAQERGCKRIITNGACDTDLGQDTAANQRSNRNRVHLIQKLAEEWEGRGLEISLISLNEAFVNPS